MARGFESKHVESQQADRERRGADAQDVGDPAVVERRRTLQLARARAEQDLANVANPAYRTVLRHAIATIDKQLATLQKGNA